MLEIDQAKTDVNNLFKDLSPMITEIVDKYSVELDKIFSKLTKTNTLSNDDLREYMLALSVETYLFGMSKDASILKQECATTLMKERQAQIYNATDGTQAVRNNQSIIDSADKQVVNLIYSGVANMMKTKIDEAHRMVNVLNSILISRNAEAKMTNSKPDDEPQQRQRLVESVNNIDENFPF